MDAEEDISAFGRIGIGSWTYPWAVGTVTDLRPQEPMSANALVRTAAELHLRVVQIADNLPLDALTSPELKSLHQLAQDYGIALQVGTRGVDPDHLLKYLRIAEELESTLVRSLGGWPGYPTPLSEVERNIRSVLPAFIDAGVSLALENYEVYPTADLANLVSTIDDPGFGICLDVTNSFAGWEIAEQILENLAPFSINAYIKDFTIERTNSLMVFAFVGQPIGQGKLPLDLILTRLAQLNRRPDLIVELWPPPQRTLEETLSLEKTWAIESVRYLRSSVAGFFRKTRKQTGIPIY
jgi:sugar phosphate isomerase/epimerase